MSTVEVVKMTGLLDLSVNQLRFDKDVQCRASIDSGTVTEYKDALSANVVFPPLVVFHDGAVYWVADGFHRGSAYRESGATKCPCDVRQGTKRDAILYACGANGKHGLPRTPKDKRRAVMTLLNDTEWREKPSRWIAEKCGVSHPTVLSIKDELQGTVEQGQLVNFTNSEPARVTGSDGKSYLAKHKPAETKPVEKAEAKLEPVREPESGVIPRTSVGLVGALLEQEDEPVDEPDDDEGQDRILRGEVFRDFKRALLHCWDRCPERFKDHFKGMAQYEVGDLK